jgi:hypothetical protein
MRAQLKAQRIATAQQQLFGGRLAAAHDPCDVSDRQVLAVAKP